MFKLKENEKYFDKIFIFVLCLVMAATAWADWVQTDKLIASDGASMDLFSHTVSMCGGYALLGAEWDDDNGSNSGSAYIFAPNEADPNKLDEVAKLLASDGAPYDEFGMCVSMGDGYAIVGARFDDDNGSNSGSVYIFAPNEVDPNNWDQVTKLTASDASAGDYFGAAVSISGDYLIVGAYYDNAPATTSGSAYVFKRTGTGWTELTKITASDGAAGDKFGCSVSIDGNYAIIGAWDADGKGTDSGCVYIFAPNEVDPNNWDEVAKLLASDGAAGDNLGVRVWISGDYAIAGARYDDDNGSNTGSAYIFKREPNSNNWTEQTKLLASDGAAGDIFGISVSISDDYAIVGAYGHDDNGSESGSAWIFKRNPDTDNWSEQVKLLASDGAAGDNFGVELCISGDYAIIASPSNDNENGTNAGAVYVFRNLPANIDVSPLSHDFGDVELGTSRTVIVTISNVGLGNLTISGITLETDFAITSVPPASIIVGPNETKDVEITYTPSALGYNSAVLKITSDDPDEPVVEVTLGAVGIEIPLPPSEQIANILAFFDESVAQGTLQGCGRWPCMANMRLKAFRHMIKAAGDLIDGEWYGLACLQLRRILLRCDEKPWPPDFVKGEAIPQLTNMVEELRNSLGCE